MRNKFFRRTFNWKDYYQRGLLAVDELLIDHKMVLNIRADGEQGDFIELDGPRLKGKLQGGTKDALRISFETAAKGRRLVAIIIDEAQHLSGVKSLGRLKNPLDSVKSSAEATRDGDDNEAEE